MMRKGAFFLGMFLMSSQVFAGSDCEFLENFSGQALKEPGVQIGVVVDSHGQDDSYAAVAKFSKGNPIALTALENAKKLPGGEGLSVTKVSYGQKGDLITAIENRFGREGRMWAFFKWTGKKWEMSKEGVSSKVPGNAAKPLRDGQVIGFSLSKWDKDRKAFETPRCPQTP